LTTDFIDNVGTGSRRGGQAVQTQETANEIDSSAPSTNIRKIASERQAIETDDQILFHRSREVASDTRFIATSSFKIIAVFSEASQCLLAEVFIMHTEFVT